ncbi:MAG: M18 family aminopeptidase [Agathobacter sp.]|nr:M18 family aminopeptidase [Agathobacter sp.]
MEQELLFDLLRKAVSPFACVQAAGERLAANGFEELCYNDEWKLKKGGKYIVNHHDTTLFAFTIGEEYKACDMVRIAAAHTDYPYLRIKPNADFVTEAYAQVNVEVYGGPILNTWFDRPLGVAGRIAVKSDNPFKPEIKMYQSKKPVMIIPNLAIHMNRDVNKGVEINNQTDLMPIADLIPEETKSVDYFLSFIAEETGIDKEDILDFELNTFCIEEPAYVGIKNTLISSPRLDNQTSVSALLSAIINADRKDGINIIALFDHEEIGSSSKQGAASILLHDMIIRILANIGADTEQINRSIYDAMMLSVDVAHGLHPNKVSKMDITNHPVLGKGFCIKEACSQSYATDSGAIGIVCQICDKYDIPYQRFVNRSDIRGGGTLGSIASTLLPIKTVDIGVPLLAMHSARELMGAADIDALEKLVEKYFAI